MHNNLYYMICLLLAKLERIQILVATYSGKIPTEDASLIPASGRSPGEGHGNPLQYSCLENPHGQRSLVGYSPEGSKELDTTETT